MPARGGDYATLERNGLPERVVTAPDLDDDAENQARLRLLTQHRDLVVRDGPVRIAIRLPERARRHPLVSTVVSSLAQ